MKKIGVVIATYNGEKYIKQQLESIINQSMKPDCIVISDGGSEDNTISICRKYLSDNSIDYKIIESKCKLGVRENFEQGLRNCDANYIFFADQDDYWLTDKIRNAMYFFESDDADVVFCNAYITDAELNKSGISLWEKIEFKPLNKVGVYEKNNVFLHNELLRHSIMTGMCMAINNRVKDIILPFSVNSIHDVWISHCINCIGKIVSNDSCDVLYRQHSNNVIGTKKNLKRSLKKRTSYVDNIRKRISFIDDVIKRVSPSYEILASYNEYKEFLYNRIKYIEKRKSFLSYISMIEDYKKYVYNYNKILLKDIFSRITLKRDKN